MGKNKQSLNLSAWQTQALADMGIDGWYLTPLHRDETPADVASGEFEQFIEQLDKPTPASHQEVKQPVSKPMPTKTTPPPQKTTTATNASQKQRKVFQAPDPITIDITGQTTAPEEDEIVFSFPALPDVSWDALLQESQRYADEVGQPCFQGIGERDTDDVLLLPPPDPLRKNAEAAEVTARLGLSDKAQHLLGELFASIGLNAAASYRTCLTKQPTAYGRDPDSNTLQTQLTLLASELALISPQRIWVFGALPAQAITQTLAPLSALVERDYTLAFNGLNGQSHSSRIIFLPTLDYLLALPAEKGKVWQQLKRFI